MYDSLLSMQRTGRGDVFTALVLEVFRLNGRLLSAGDALTRPAGQTSARWQVLGALDDGPLTVADVGRRMGLTRQSVQRTADLLEAEGLVSYALNPAHQRAKLTTLTARGRATLDAITTRQIEWANRIASRLVAEDLHHTIRTLQQVRAGIDAGSPEAVHRPRGRTQRRSAP
jgi:DNA-binding MarR family transcriptional regulator